MLRLTLTCAASALAIGMISSAPAQALTMKECSAKYQAAKTANTLKGQKWNDFRKAQCSDEDASDSEAAAAAPAEPAAPAPATTTAAAPAKPAATARRSGAAVFPRSVSTKYANETPGKARLHTCVDQYNANKANGGNADLKWIQAGGGYWSQCNTKLKG
ncbi:MAG: hypothetical protein BGP06_07800 [Rhizobiales bacterium 65-9]|nr:MAG: hypothetical protein BGP06_07800 [Rhizobiales bacterium 65-9]